MTAQASTPRLNISALATCCASSLWTGSDNDLVRAATLEGYADAALRAQGFEREFTETTTRDRLMALLADQLAPADLSRLLTEGAALSPQAAITLAVEEP